MSFQITTAFVTDFKAGFTLRAQQEMTRLRQYCDEPDSINGTEFTKDFVGKRSPTRREDRHGTTVRSDTPHERRWGELYVYDDADLIDKPDLVRTLTDPTNIYNRTMTAGFGRKIDEIAMDAALGTTRTGQAGDSSSTGPTNTIAAGGAGMTIAKMTTALRYLNAAEQPQERNWVYTAAQEYDMLGLPEVKSSDYAVTKALALGEIREYAGFRFTRVESPILKTDGSGDRKTVVFVNGAICLGFGANVQASIDRLPERRNSTQVFVSMDMGGCRLDDDGVIQVTCVES